MNKVRILFNTFTLEQIRKKIHQQEIIDKSNINIIHKQKIII